MGEFSVVGTSVNRIDGLGKVIGETRYLNDIKLPGMLYGEILRSPHAHAKILKIDTTKAKKLPGVRAVITAKDTPKKKFGSIPELADRQMLCEEKVRFVGDEVAAVAAESMEAALKALNLIEVEYEVLPVIDNIHQALKPDTPLIHDDKEENISWEIHREFGDMARGFAEADFIFENDFTTSRVSHSTLETRGVIADWSSTGTLKIWSPTQAPHTLRQELSRILDIPISHVIVERTPVGGGFGQRLVMDMKDPIAAVLSIRTKRPVKIINTREEEFQTAGTRYPYHIHLKTGITKEGRIRAQEISIYVNNGAYNDKGSATLGICATQFLPVYNVPNKKIDGYLVYTNQKPSTAFRGFGNPQLHFSLESQMDIMARKLGIDPLAIRKINANKPGMVPGTQVYIPSCEMEQCLNLLNETVNWKNKKEQSGTITQGKRYGIGMAGVIHSGGGGRHYGYNSAQAFLKISEDGLVTLITPAVEIGQGVTTGLAQIAAEILGITTDRILIRNESTDLVGYDLGALGSRSLFVHGLAIKAAAQDAKAEVLEIASKYFGVPEKEIVLKNNQVYVTNNPSRCVSWEKLIDYSYRILGKPLSGEGEYYDDVAPEVRKMGKIESMIPTYAFGTVAVEVLVDEETGHIEVLNITFACDIGTVVNPSAASGQLEGGVLQGLGYAFLENTVVKEGRIVNPNFTDYKIFTTQELPDIKVLFAKSWDPEGPLGAKGIGELCLVPIAAACANAVEDAIGIRFFEIPITPEKIKKALKERRAAEDR